MYQARPLVAYHCPWETAAAWLAELQAAAPALDVREAGAIEVPDAVEAAVVWAPPPGLLRRFPRLRVVHAMGAGVDELLTPGTAADLPPHVPLLRLLDPLMAERMAHWVVWGVLSCQRGFALYAHQQQRGTWVRHMYADIAEEFPVGILGLGSMGAVAARALRGLGFPVHGWSRTTRRVEGVTCRHGEAGLRATAAAAKALVCLLPLTPNTAGILNAALFDAMPAGSFVLNAARGQHLVTGDLLAALASGRLAGAVLDVFATEPLLPEDPLWRQPGVTITPHVASLSLPASGAAVIARNLEAALAGHLPEAALVRRERGY